MKKIFTKDEIGSKEWIETAVWCSKQPIENNKYWLIEKGDDDKYHLIQREIVKTKEEEIQECHQFLENTDNYALRLAAGEDKPEDYSETYQMTFGQIMQKRKEAREKIQELEETSK